MTPAGRLERLQREAAELKRQLDFTVGTYRNEHVNAGQPQPIAHVTFAVGRDGLEITIATHTALSLKDATELVGELSKRLVPQTNRPTPPHACPTCQSGSLEETGRFLTGPIRGASWSEGYVLDGFHCRRCHQAFCLQVDPDEPAGTKVESKPFGNKQLEQMVDQAEHHPEG